MPGKKFYFTPSYDIMLLQEVSAVNPWGTKNGWIQVSNSIRQIPVFEHIETKTVRERTRLLISRFRKDDMAGIRKSGTEKEYDEREKLLQEVCEKEREFSQQSEKRKIELSSAADSRNKAARVAESTPPFVPLSVSIPAIDEGLLELEASEMGRSQSPLPADIRMPSFGLPGPSATSFASGIGEETTSGLRETTTSGLKETTASDNPSSARSEPLLLSPGRITGSTFLQNFLVMNQAHFEANQSLREKELQLRKEELEIRRREAAVAGSTAEALLQLVKVIAETIKK